MKFKWPKSPFVAAFVPNHTLKRPKCNFFDQNDCWVEIIKGETSVENLRCGAAIVTKIVKNKKVVKKQKYPLKTLKCKYLEFYL